VRIQGTAAIITGGASGLGEATAREFASAGGGVVIFDIDEDRGRAIANELDGVFARVDINDESSVASGIEAGRKRYGSARILVNCAGIGIPLVRTVGKDGPYPLDIFRRAIEVNLIGAFNVTRLAAAAMNDLEPLERGERGVLVNVSSINALDAPAGTVAYTAAKAGVVGMTLVIARDLARRGIRCCTVVPGNFETPMLMEAPEEGLRQLLQMVPFPNDRFGDPADFARLVRHVCENVMLNGATIRLDGAVRHAMLG
jgi:NAD(P)-dependent dehydrogenase (short-subunit alcohol dehydrogenase family)